MSKSKSNNMSTIAVALTLCLVCSVLVSAVAVGLKPMQLANAQLDINKNILVAAGDFDPATETNDDVAAKFESYEVKIANLSEGTFADQAELDTVGIVESSYKMASAVKDVNLSNELTEDTAGIGRVPKYAKVYIKNDANGQPESIVLPIYGAGLWGKIYGFLTLESDMNTIKGISFYDHKETPGLGALITEDKFRSQFPSLQAYDESGNVALAVTKAGMAKDNQVDGVSGATLTSKGVNNFIQFWLSDMGYKKLLDNLATDKAGEV